MANENNLRWKQLGAKQRGKSPNGGDRTHTKKTNRLTRLDVRAEEIEPSNNKTEWVKIQIFGRFGLFTNHTDRLLFMTGSSMFIFSSFEAEKKKKSDELCD